MLNKKQCTICKGVYTPEAGATTLIFEFDFSGLNLFPVKWFLLYSLKYSSVIQLLNKYPSVICDVLET